jgi:hypothetical protein
VYLADDKKEWVRSGVATSVQQTKEAGYHVDLLLFKTGEGIEVLEEKLKEKWGGVIIGSSILEILADSFNNRCYDLEKGYGLRSIQSETALFEASIRAIHEICPDARIGFNTKPDDSVEAAKRILPL